MRDRERERERDRERDRERETERERLRELRGLLLASGASPELTEISSCFNI